MMVSVSARIVAHAGAPAQSLPPFPVGASEVVCVYCSTVKNGQRPYCRMGAELPRTSHGVCRYCSNEWEKNPATRAKWTNRRRRHTDQLAMIAEQHPAPTPPKDEPPAEPWAVAIVPTALSAQLPHFPRATPVYVALCRRGAQQATVPIIYAQLCRELHVKPLTLRRTLQALEARGYASHYDSGRRAYWHVQFDPTR